MAARFTKALQTASGNRQRRVQARRKQLAAAAERIGERAAQRQQSRQQKRAARQQRKSQRLTGRIMRQQTRVEGKIASGYFTPEGVAARRSGAAQVVSATAPLVGGALAAAAAAKSGGASLSGIGPAGIGALDVFGQPVDSAPLETSLPPVGFFEGLFMPENQGGQPIAIKVAVLGGSALALYYILNPKK
jgi:hypothetical protein